MPDEQYPLHVERLIQKLSASDGSHETHDEDPLLESPGVLSAVKCGLVEVTIMTGGWGGPALINLTTAGRERAGLPIYEPVNWLGLFKPLARYIRRARHLPW